MASIRERLLAVEDDFVYALASGNDALVAFHDNWERLMEDVDAALQSNCLENDLGALVYATAMRVATLVDISEDLHTSYESCTAQLVDQLEVFMSDLTLLDMPAPRDRNIQKPSAFTTPVSCPPSATRKRRRASEPDYEYENGGQLYKRHRVSDEPQVSGIERGCQPFETEQVLSSHHYHVSLSPSPLRVVPKRKRRFSDAEPADPAPVHKRRYIGPRLHAVSDSYITGRSIESSTETATIPPSPARPCSAQASTSTSQPVEAPSEQSNTLSSLEVTAREQSTSSDLPDLDGASLALPGLDSLDVFLETIFQRHDITGSPVFVSGSDIPKALQDNPAAGLAQHSSQPYLSSSASDTVSTPASSTPSSPRSAPDTPLMDTDILKFDLGASQCFPIGDEWRSGEETQLHSFFDAIPPLSESKWTCSPIAASWLDVSRLISPSLDEEFESLL
ncbi:hypothetical protein NUW54_g6375 [Trametes sanguinea]|uniref:Uncharacterized protein n=1 Tax=Trametes sanguinea TaxID=158606 RepID=A0ACC1PV07_9APHY|nr:hypothetical protein NUW54_g6375 [Trametes sanguinea]